MSPFVKAEFDKLSDYKKEQFQKLVMWSNAGEPGQTLMSDHAYLKIMEQVSRMDEPVIEAPVETQAEESKSETKE